MVNGDALRKCLLWQSLGLKYGLVESRGSLPSSRGELPRTPRCHQGAEEACYHVFSRGHNRETVFADAEDRRYFLDLIVRYQKRFPALRLFHYCLMSNHFHLRQRAGSADLVGQGRRAPTLQSG